MLDLGCGAGQLAHDPATNGAADGVGVDLSERMLSPAQAEWTHPNVTYQRASIEEVAFPPDRFDLVVSSLAFHYVDDAGMAVRISRWLAPGGLLGYSTEHPMFTARLPGDGWALSTLINGLVNGRSAQSALE
ncbi:MAG: class I SAM-dependent methyltransferase [Chloroflexi bacterium]|nr:class I SAM-dependent methyltransferase [Chloroflexota bacterium]